ncbi:endonuclease [Candidatus Berkelbacteria bacterium CG10_big_fil_rev_8_21_14_0_10_43_13]|uniref:Endonuclease n=1 Tax=Candidatus Berkelbacteria bacterium CG10_big_fil_rev_8_21_14_0_10_43_13 TaxID=1974514 RepID=A0A2H0W679_9BACT|nr:MAG: endonuclease [Candidatus Berkelbacteria bacterium CG10_big_fil_rev_8_21_14_0_10_43_13]
MYFVYVLKSTKRNYHYIGISNNLSRRINQHNKGYNKTTKPYTPFKLIYSEKYPDRVSARTREKQLKSGCGREFIRKIDI